MVKRPVKYPLVRRVFWILRGYHPQPALDILMESQWWPRARLADFRSAKLKRLVEHCYEHVPHYRDVMRERDLRPADVTRVEDLPKLPPLSKSVLRGDPQRLCADNVPRESAAESRTSGTTGEPVAIRRCIQGQAWGMACYARGLSWGGLLPHMPRIKLRSLVDQGPPGWLDQAKALFPPWQSSLPIGDLTEQNAIKYVETIRRSPARHVIGYPSALYLLARCIERQRLSCPLETVFPTAEMLLERWRPVIARAFSCQVRPYYGCCEVISLAFDCGEGYHTCDEHAVVEVERPDGSVSFVGEGAFLLTDLDNYAMPLLRYRNGDAGVLSDEPCLCGRTLGRIARLQGRSIDMLVACDGTVFPGGSMDHILVDILGIAVFQLVQFEPGQLTVRMVVTEAYDRAAAEVRLDAFYRKYLGPAARIAFEYPNDIRRTPADKLRVVVNHYLAGRAAGGGLEPCCR